MKNEGVEFQTIYNSNNKLYRWFTKRFLNHLSDLIYPLLIDNNMILDVGCGEGFVTRHLQREFKNIDLTALDLKKRRIKITKHLSPHLKAVEGNIYNLPFRNRSFDIVLANEVLEHLDRPKKALEQIKRVSNSYIIVSVPHQPFFSIDNIIRGAYLSKFGRTPEHVNFWNRQEIVKLLARFYVIKEVESCIPWTFVLCKN
jgi:SAM-dependent methyltransferase